jgi:hypothetical protein
MMLPDDSAPQDRHSPGSATTNNQPYLTTTPSERGYVEAAHHLLNHGLTPAPNLPALRAMWKAGGAHRRAAQVIAERWEVAA